MVIDPKKMLRAPAYKFKSNDPASQERYTERVLTKFNKDIFLYRFGTLNQLCVFHCQRVDLNFKIEFLHNNIVVSTIVIQKKVKKSICNFFQNFYPWFPHLQMYTDHL